MKCETCKNKIENLTELTICFDICNPQNMTIKCKNNYKKLSMADTITFRKQVHTVLDECLDKTAIELFVQKVKA